MSLPRKFEVNGEQIKHPHFSTIYWELFRFDSKNSKKLTQKLQITEIRKFSNFAKILRIFAEILKNSKNVDTKKLLYRGSEISVSW